MKPTMIAVCAALALSVAAAPGAAQVGKSQLERSVEIFLVQFGFRVDARSLSLNQLASLHVLHAVPRNYSDTREEIRTILSRRR